MKPESPSAIIVIKESKEAHQLIEEWMLMANKAVAEKVSEVKIKDKPLPFPYRVHDQPNEEKLEPFMAFARKFGYKFNTNSPEEIASSFNAMLADLQKEPRSRRFWSNWVYAPWPKPFIPRRILVTMALDSKTTAILPHPSEGILM
jgi:exoribonuclease R